jgi:Heavy-metal resistance
MRRWWLVIALLLSVGLNLGILGAILARRAPRPEPREPRPQEAMDPAADPLPRLPRLADRLGLEGAERRKFIDIQWNLFQKTSRLRLQRGEVHRELKLELTREEPDRQRVNQLLSESAGIYGAMERALVDSVLATRDLLDPEQEKEYLRFVGRLRVPSNPGGGLGGQGPGPQRQPPRGDRDRPFPNRMQERRDRRMGDRFPEGPPPEDREDRRPPPMFEDEGRPEEGPPDGPPPQ